MSQEVANLYRLVNGSHKKTGQWDLEALEVATRVTMHRAGAAFLEGLLDGAIVTERQVQCGCGQQARFHELRPKQILTVLGRVYLQRPYYICESCHRGQSPLDRQLDVVGTTCSPGVRRMMALVGSEGSFEQGRQQMEVLAGLEVTSKTIERQAEAIGEDIAGRERRDSERARQLDLPETKGADIEILYMEMDGTGVPVVNAETEGRQGKVVGQPAHTREVKLGCVFTQTTIDDRGRPVRDEASTTYTAAIETAEAFGRRLFSEAWNRGLSRARRKVIIGDGAPWIWNIANEHFPGATQIVDIYHARQHLWKLGSVLFPTDLKRRARWVSRLQPKLDSGQIESLVRSLRRLHASDELAGLVAAETDYFSHNADRMRYSEFRNANLFIGSGVVEAGCKTVIASRMKRSGMFWSVRGANAIIALRCNRLSNKFEDYWVSRLAA